MENLYECQGFGQDTPCIHAPLDASSLLVPCLLLVQLENLHVLQDGWLRSISKSWAEGWKSEETRKHLFENWVARIESVNLWIRSVQFMNEFRPVLWTWFFEKIWCKVYTLDVATVLMNAWSRARTVIKTFIKQLLKLWRIPTQSYHMTSEDFNLLHWLQYFHFHYIDKNHQVILQEFTLCVQLKQVWNITSASNIDHTCYVRLEYLVRRDGLFMNLLIFDFLVPGTTD